MIEGGLSTVHPLARCPPTAKDKGIVGTMPPFAPPLLFCALLRPLPPQPSLRLICTQHGVIIPLETSSAPCNMTSTHAGNPAQIGSCGLEDKKRRRETQTCRVPHRAPIVKAASIHMYINSSAPIYGLCVHI
jgi:hypothetical protein